MFNIIYAVWIGAIEFGSAMHRGLPISTYAPRETGWGGGSSLPYISIAYYMKKGREGVQIARKIVYVLNGRPHTYIYIGPDL